MDIRKYEETVYAGVLGKIIGVYLGRPVEGWPYQRIIDEFGEISYYKHQECNSKQFSICGKIRKICHHKKYKRTQIGRASKIGRASCR